MSHSLSALKSLNLLPLGLVLVLGLGSAGPELALADEIYHWVDADGVHHYSQSPPAKASRGVETLEVDGSRPASYNPDEDRYNIVAQEAAMQALRDELEENRKNNQKLQQSSAENTVVYYPAPNFGNEIFYAPGFGPNPPNGPNRPRPPDRPERPDGKPDRPGTLPEDPPPASRPYRPQP